MWFVLLTWGVQLQTLVHWSVGLIYLHLDVFEVYLKDWEQKRGCFVLTVCFSEELIARNIGDLFKTESVNVDDVGTESEKKLRD